MTEARNRRRRPPVSCALCRRRKLKCNREVPCSNCIKSKNEPCIYEVQPMAPAWQTSLVGKTQTIRCSTSGDEGSNKAVTPTYSNHGASSLAASSNPQTPATSTSHVEIESLQNKIRQLELKLAQTNASAGNRTDASRTQTSSTNGPAVREYHHRSDLFGEARTVGGSIMHKQRLFGQSHWSNGVALIHEFLEIMEPEVRKGPTNLMANMQRCKRLARKIKSHRRPPWPLPLTRDLPAKTLADDLLDAYLRSTESVYRILHIPTFRRQYDAVWLPGTEAEAGFLVQLKLVLAIGATTYDDGFSLRDTAIRWVYEALTWMANPEFKSKLGLQLIQNHILLELAQGTVDVGGSFTWVAAGSLLRLAIDLGLHRDPACLPRRSALDAEMRRRIWNTIMEMTVQTSMNSGGPPMLSLEDFDTKPPGNFDDDQLETEDPAPKPAKEYTQTSMAIALRRSFPARLAVTQYLNDLSSHTSYDETLRLDTQLRGAYKSLSQTLQGLASSAGPTPSQFEIRLVDFTMRRYLSSLHIPYFGLSLKDNKYAFSRSVVIESALKLWCATYPASSVMSDQAASGDLSRLASCGTAFFRGIAMQSCVLIGIEVQTILQQDESLGPVSVRSDLLSVVNDGKDWTWKCIENGETSIKGYLFMSLFVAQIKALIQGLPKEETAAAILKAAEDAEERCVAKLEEAAARSNSDGVLEESELLAQDTPSDIMANWDLMMPTAQYNFVNAEPMDWYFSVDNMQQTFFDP